MDLDARIHANYIRSTSLEQELMVARQEREVLIKEKQNNCVHNYERDESDYGPYERQPFLCTLCGKYK